MRKFVRFTYSVDGTPCFININAITLVGVSDDEPTGAAIFLGDDDEAVDVSQSIAEVMEAIRIAEGATP